MQTFLYRLPSHLNCVCRFSFDEELRYVLDTMCWRILDTFYIWLFERYEQLKFNQLNK